MATGRSITGLTAQAEQIVQETLFMRISRRYDAAIRNELSRAYMDFSRAHRSEGDIRIASERHRANIERILVSQWESSFDLIGGRVIDSTEKSLRGSFKSIEEPVVDKFRRYMLSWISMYGAAKVTEISGTTIKQAREIITSVVSASVIDGLGEAATARILRDRMSEHSAVMSGFRSRMISRTESHSAANASTLIAAEASDVIGRQEWVASVGERTREAHIDADGQIVRVGENFIVGGEPLRHPGDPNGSAGNVINCRCAVILMA